MKKYATLNTFITGTIVTILALFLTSCDSPTSPDDESTGDENYVLSLAYQGTGGTFTYYTVGFDDVMEGNLSAVGQGIGLPGYYTFNHAGDAVYATGGFELTDIVAIRKNEEGELVQTGGNSSFDTSIQDIVETEDGNLVAIEMSSSSDVVKLHQISPESVTVQSSTTTPASVLSDSTTAYSGMVQTGDHLFVTYYASNPNSFATNLTDTARVAVFSYPSLEFVKVIKDDRTGPIGGFGALSGLIKDENGNVYALSHSNPANGYSKFTKDPAILRINSGETEFDDSYIFDFNTVADGKTTAHMVYLENGRVFVEMNTLSRAEQSRWSDSPLKPAILDLSAKTIDYVDDVPEHSGIGRELEATSLYDGEYIYMVVPEKESSYVYRIDASTLSAEKGAEVQANFTAGFFQL